MPRPVLILIVVLVVIVGGMFALAGMDREVPQTRVERPLSAPANDAAK